SEHNHRGDACRQWPVTDQLHGSAWAAMHTARRFAVEKPEAACSLPPRRSFCSSSLSRFLSFWECGCPSLIRAVSPGRATSSVSQTICESSRILDCLECCG